MSDEPFRLNFETDPMLAGYGDCQSESAAKLLAERVEPLIEEAREAGLTIDEQRLDAAAGRFTARADRETVQTLKETALASGIGRSYMDELRYLHALPYEALAFAANAHKHQRRKGARQAPYINHLIQVMQILVQAQVDEPGTLAAAALHDVIEDCNITERDLLTHFPSHVVAMVAEVTDDKSLPADERKRLQVEHAPSLSPNAKAIKIADKIANVRDLRDDPPDWHILRQQAYVRWAVQVVAGCRYHWPLLDRHFDDVVMGHR